MEIALIVFSFFLFFRYESWNMGFTVAEDGIVQSAIRK